LSGWQLLAPNPPPNLYHAHLENAHRKPRRCHRVADRLSRRWITQKYYAVFKFHGKTKWIP